MKDCMQKVFDWVFSARIRSAFGAAKVRPECSREVLRNGYMRCAEFKLQRIDHKIFCFQEHTTHRPVTLLVISLGEQNVEQNCPLTSTTGKLSNGTSNVV